MWSLPLRQSCALPLARQAKKHIGSIAVSQITHEILSFLQNFEFSPSYPAVEQNNVDFNKIKAFRKVQGT